MYFLFYYNFFKLCSWLSTSPIPVYNDFSTCQISSRSHVLTRWKRSATYDPAVSDCTDPGSPATGGRVGGRPSRFSYWPLIRTREVPASPGRPTANQARRGRTTNGGFLGALRGPGDRHSRARASRPCTYCCRQACGLLCAGGILRIRTWTLYFRAGLRSIRSVVGFRLTWSAAL